MLFLQGPHVGVQANKLTAQKQFRTQQGQWLLGSHIARAIGSTAEQGAEGNHVCELVTALLGQGFALYSKSEIRKKDAMLPCD